MGAVVAAEFLGTTERLRGVAGAILPLDTSFFEMVVVHGHGHVLLDASFLGLMVLPAELVTEFLHLVHTSHIRKFWWIKFYSLWVSIPSTGESTALITHHVRG